MFFGHTSQPELLFVRNHLSEFLDTRLREAKAAVDQVARPDFERREGPAIVEHILSQFDVRPIDMKEDEKTLEEDEVDIDASRFFEDYMFHRGGRLIRGTRLTVTIPFVGSPELFHLRPSTFDLNPPRAIVDTGELKVVVEGPPSKGHAYYRQRIEQTLTAVDRYLSDQKPEIEEFRKKLRRTVAAAVQARRERLGASSKIASSLGIPLKKKGGTPALPVSVKRNPSLVGRVRRADRPGEARERTLSAEDYEAILSLIRHQSRTFEGAPAAFNTLEEEHLRDVVLSSLNAVYQGDATGETFRKQGKTDIRIEAEDRSAFVAELKIWNGPKALTDAIDQLLSYVTWRDTKVALVIFNKTVKGFSKLLTDAAVTAAKHPACRSAPVETARGEWSFEIQHPDDPEHVLTCRLMVYDLRS